MIFMCRRNAQWQDSRSTLKQQTIKTIISPPYGDEMAASQIRVKMSNNNNRQRITVMTMQKQRVASPPSLTPFSHPLLSPSSLTLFSHPLLSPSSLTLFSHPVPNRKLHTISFQIGYNMDLCKVYCEFFCI